MSCLNSFTHGLQDPWQTSPTYRQEGLQISTTKFLEITNLLLANPNLNSSHLFRADILHDSAGTLQTPAQKEQSLHYLSRDSAKSGNSGFRQHDDLAHSGLSTINTGSSTSWPDFELRRTVIRTLIPRKPQLDRVLEQLCLIYISKPSSDDPDGQSWMVVYYPRVQDEESMPWYHPPVKALAYLYEPSPVGTTLSAHFLPFRSTADDIPPRLDRTMLSLLQRFVKLAKHPPRDPPSRTDSNPHSGQAERSLATSDLKDTIIPQHLVQDSYTRLKQTYAADLIASWVEKTAPSKHVFEDLAIAAFLIELWKQMYASTSFPGFVDLACGNGVLVYTLRQEGYEGFGIDARRRKTWEVLGMDEHLHEEICVPRPFLDVLGLDASSSYPKTGFHNGKFSPGTFIISNHADELTPWTPILATLSSPEAPLPFLAIPCCSHALSGARHRYSPKDARPALVSAAGTLEEQPATGDLRALGAAKVKAATHSDDKSMYSCLTRKVVALAEELGSDVELTLMRIPSTRNIGIVGNRRRVKKIGGETFLDVQPTQEPNGSTEEKSLESIVNTLLERECKISGGIGSAAKTWLEGAQKLQASKGRGKVNLEKAEHG